MHVSGWDQTSVPSLSFHALEKQGVGGGAVQNNGWRRGRTSEIATFLNPVPMDKATQGHPGPTG